MTDFRVIATNLEGAEVVPVITYQKGDHLRLGMFAPGSGKWIFFKDIQYTTCVVHDYGGPTGGAIGGHPLYLVFWGSWWNGAGLDTRTLIADRAKALCESVYFEELTQYKVLHAPVWKGCTTVVSPAPPGAVEKDDATDGMEDVIEGLIDDGTIPDPDDGPRWLFVFLMPAGFSVTDSTATGSHSNSYAFDAPLDTDKYWYGWVGPPKADLESNMIDFSHEIVEMLTDPEADAWRWKPEHKKQSFTEISDLLFATGGSFQTAFVNGVQVQSYWSRRHNAPLIPIDQDYASQLTARIVERSRRIVDSGTFRLTPEDKAFCRADRPECCFEDRDYEWRLYSINEIAKVRINKHRYRTVVSDFWSIDGHVVFGEGDITLTKHVEKFIGQSSSIVEQTVTVHYKERTAGVDVSTINTGVNFSIIVSGRVSEGAITGNNINNVYSNPSVEIDFMGGQVLLEDKYHQQMDLCQQSLIKKFIVKYKQTGRPQDHNPVDELFPDDPLPAYVRPSLYRRIREARKASLAANSLLGTEIAMRYMRSTLSRIPILAALSRSTRRSAVKG